MSKSWWIGLVSLLVTACYLRRDDTAVRCHYGIDHFQTYRCDSVLPTVTDAPVVKVEYQRFQRQCTDRKSVARLQELAPCVAAYQDKATANQSQHDAIRAKYARATDAVKADPTYMPLLEAWALARDEAQVAAREWELHGRTSVSPYYRVMQSKQKVLDEKSAALRQLLERHGVDPKYSGILGIW